MCCAPCCTETPAASRPGEWGLADRQPEDWGGPRKLEGPPRSLGTPHPQSREDALELSQGRAGERGRLREAVSPRPVHPGQGRGGATSELFINKVY